MLDFDVSEVKLSAAVFNEAPNVVEHRRVLATCLLMHMFAFAYVGVHQLDYIFSDCWPLKCSWTVQSPM